jgi:hypothetical protein
MLETSDGVVRAFASAGCWRRLRPTTTRRRVSRRSCALCRRTTARRSARDGASADSAGRIWMTAWNGWSNTRQASTTRACGFRLSGRGATASMPDARGAVGARAERCRVQGKQRVDAVGFPENAGMATVCWRSRTLSVDGNPTGLSVVGRDLAGMRNRTRRAALGEHAYRGRDGVLWGLRRRALRIRKKMWARCGLEGAATSGTAYALWGRQTAERGGLQGRAVR